MKNYTRDSQGRFMNTKKHLAMLSKLYKEYFDKCVIEVSPEDKNGYIDLTTSEGLQITPADLYRDIKALAEGTYTGEYNSNLDLLKYTARRALENEMESLNKFLCEVK